MVTPEPTIVEVVPKVVIPETFILFVLILSVPTPLKVLPSP